MVKGAAYLSLQLILHTKSFVLKLKNMQRCAVHRPPVIFWVVRDRTVTGKELKILGLIYLIAGLPIALQRTHSMEDNCVRQASLSYLLQSACLLLSPVEVCQEEIFLGPESSHGVRGKMVLLDYKDWGIKELIWVSTSGNGLSVRGVWLLNRLVTTS